MHFIRKLYPDSIIVAGLGKYQDTDSKRINAWKKGYQKGQPDLMIMNYKKNYFGCCIEFKSPKNNYQVSEAQREMKHKYRNNGITLWSQMIVTLYVKTFINIWRV